MLYLVLNSILVPGQTDVSTVVEIRIPGDFYFYDSTREYIFTNKADIKEFSSLVINKTAERVRYFAAKELIGNEIAVLDWGYKGRNIIISDSGRMLIKVPKHDIRKISRIHWFWWKINVILDRTNYVAYITEADKRVADKMIEIKSKKTQFH